MKNETKGIEFNLTPEQVIKFREWAKGKVIPPTAIGGAYTICFTPTGLGDIVEVRCVDGTRLSLTDYDTF
jgi:hypothetical protein